MLRKIDITRLFFLLPLLSVIIATIFIVTLGAEAVSQHKWEVGQGTGLTTTEFVIKDARVGINAIRLAIDASGNVGIGTTAPTYGLDVKSTDGGAALRVQHNDNIGDIEMLSFSTGGVFVIRNSAGAGAIAFDGRGTNNSYFNSGNVGIGTTEAGTNKLKVQGTMEVMGSFTASNQPCARAYLSANTSALNSQVQVPLNATTYNVGGCFNTTAHQFTAPVAGYYQVNASIMYEYGTDQRYYGIWIKVNSGYPVQTQITCSGSNWLSSTVSDIIYLNAGDTVELYTNHNHSGGIIIEGGSWFTYMSIRLLG
jgi:hypothetical protein